MPEDRIVTTVPRRRMPGRTRLLIFVTAWLILLMPILFWRATWFGRSLSDSDISKYLRDDPHPRNIQHALVQVGERISRRQDATRWYPELVRLSTHPVEEIRNTDAWVMGQDPSRPEFHAALLAMLHDGSTLVRSNAALALVRFGDASGHDQIVAMLQPVSVVVPQTGRITATAGEGTAIRQNGMVARLKSGDQEIEVRSPIAGRIRSVRVQTGDPVAAGTELATVAPNEDQVWEALRALYVIGRLEDLPAIAPYLAAQPDFADRIRQQAALTEQAIRDRAK